MVLDGFNFTPLQAKFMRLLSDGRPHTRDEIREAVEDPLYANYNISDLVMRVRRYLHPRGLDIVCVKPGRKTFYRLVRVITPGE